MKVHDAARKHGILPEDAIQAATWAISIEDLDAIHLPANSGWGSTPQEDCLRQSC